MYVRQAYGSFGVGDILQRDLIFNVDMPKEWTEYNTRYNIDILGNWFHNERFLSYVQLVLLVQVMQKPISNPLCSVERKTHYCKTLATFSILNRRQCGILLSQTGVCSLLSASQMKPTRAIFIKRESWQSDAQRLFRLSEGDIQITH